MEKYKGFILDLIEKNCEKKNKITHKIYDFSKKYLLFDENSLKLETQKNQKIKILYEIEKFINKNWLNLSCQIINIQNRIYLWIKFL